MELDDHAEELASSLGVDKAEVKEDLGNLRSYDVPIDEAKQSLRRKYGDDTGGEQAPSVDGIEDVTTRTGSVSLTARVLTRGTREIQFDGERQVIREGELADETGTIGYTAWEEFGFESGDTLDIQGASVREFRGEPELNLGDSTSVTILDDALEVPYRVGGTRSIEELAVGDSGRTIEAVIEAVETRTIDGRDGEMEIKSGELADETGRLPFTDWGARDDITEGATLELADVYVREFRGVPEVSLSEYSEVESIDRDIDPGEAATTMAIGEAIDSGGAYDVELTGTVLEVRDDSGLIERCPECNRIAQNGQCRSHGSVETIDDLRTKAILDDGTGSVTVVLDDDQTEAIYGGTLEDALEEAREAMDQSVVGEAIAEEIVGYPYAVRGHLSVDDFGATVEAMEFERLGTDPAAEARSFLAEVGR